MRTSLPAVYLAVALCVQSLALGSGPVEAADPKGGEFLGARFHVGTSARDISFRYELGHIILPVRVADSLAVDMILDTGLGVNGAIILDPGIGETLGLRYSGVVPLGGGGTTEPTLANASSGVALSLPGVTFPGQTLFVVTDPEPYRAYPGRGLIGRTVLNCAMEVDYERSVIHLYDKDAYRPPDGVTPFKVTFTYGIPVIEAMVSTDGTTENSVKLMVDTGAVELLLFAWTGSGFRTPARLIAGRDRVLSKGFTGTVNGATGRIASLQLGPHILRQVITSFPDSATWGSASLLGQHGMLGNDGLRHFIVSFDYARERIYLRPNARFEEPFEMDMTGLLWEPAPGGSMAVVDVIPDSPAAESGIEKGDLILALDGRPVQEMGWVNVEKLFQREGVVVTMAIRRGAEFLEKTIRTRRLI